MKISCAWLKDYIECDLSPSELAERLTMLGLEAESVEPLGGRYEGVVVGHVLSVERHPNADRLSVCEVDVGAKRLTIVCGAPNVAAGQKVPVAMVGAELANGLRIREVPVRGVSSEGMICAEDELGLSEDHSGTMVFPEDAQVGESLERALGLRDTIIDLDITPNRPDCLSLIGVAREIGAITGQELKVPCPQLEEKDPEVIELASVEILDPEGCPRYSARVITDVRVGPSPLWLRRRLEAAGLRPINNVVDATNYVLMEWGHPLHAFDLKRLTGRKIVVRRAAVDERILMLDGVERTLDEHVLAIADAERVVAVAGVMGGEETGVREDTQDVLLESAYFSPKVIRAGARYLGLSTEASQRFERGADFNATVPALDRAAEMIADLTDGCIARGVLDVYPKRLQEAAIHLRPEKVKGVLGTEIGADRTVEILTALGCKIRPEGEGLLAIAPSFRPDLAREIDLIEEVARVYGYDAIESREVVAGALGVQRTPGARLAEEMRNSLIGLGMTEVVTGTLVDPDALRRVDPDVDPIALSNPQSRDASALRSTLLPSLLAVARRNLNYKAERVRIFEIGRIFSRCSGEEPFSEKLQVEGVLIGARDEAFWGGVPENTDFFDFKGILETFVRGVFARKMEIQRIEAPIYEEGYAAAGLLNGETIGTFGKVAPSIASAFDIEEECFAFSLDFPALLSQCSDRRFRPLPRFPAVERDLAVIVDREVPSGRLVDAIVSVNPELIETARIFDVYKGEQVPSGKKGLAVSLVFRSESSTLSDRDAEGLCAEILDRLSRDFGAKLRV